MNILKVTIKQRLQGSQHIMMNHKYSSIMLTIEAINLRRTDNTMDTKRQKEKQGSTKHYTEN